MFDGSDYKQLRDRCRLSEQYDSIFALMRDGAWRTLADIESKTGYRSASISAQLRNMRKIRFGAHLVNKRYVSNGLYEYQLLVTEKATSRAA